jgi:hypothetical protein
LASRRRRRKGIGKVLTSVERKVRRIQKRPGARRLKRNVVTTEKILPRAIVTKKIATDAVTANEAEFGVTVVTDTEPIEYLKEGTTWVNPDDGATQVYSTDISDFVLITDAAASAAANDAYDLADTKNTVYRQDDVPTGGTYKINDIWIDTNDANQLYVWNGSSWVSARDANIATAQSDATAAQSTANGKNTVYYSTSAPGSTANTAGDIWFQYSSGIIVAQFIGAGGTSWTSTTVGNAVIANLDAGKITTGILNVAGTVKISTNTSGSRIELNPTGFYAYNGSTETVKILAADGSAFFTGTITASTFETDSLVGGRYIKIEGAGTSDRIFFYNTGAFTSPGYIAIRSDSTFDIVPPYNGAITNRLTLESGSYTYLYGGATDSYFRIGASDAYISKNTQIAGTLTVTSGSSTSSNVKKIKATATSGTPTGGADGDIVIVYT